MGSCRDWVTERGAFEGLNSAGEPRSWMLEKRMAVEMVRWCHALLLLLALARSASGQEATQAFPTDNLINNVVRDPQTGRVYLGAVNAVYQLDSSLRLERRTETGPRRDSHQCTPPIPQTCKDAKQMDNINKLLLLHPANGSLVVCGSLFKGLCSLLNISNIEEQVYYSDTKGEKTYVASIEESVSVVGVMASFEKDGDDLPVFLVGKGYGSQDSAKLISTRILQDYREWVVFENIVEASTVQANPFFLKYLHDFRHAFKDDDFLYFLFSRTMGASNSRNFTFVARLCESDPHYFSYTELQLSCGHGNAYNKVRAAHVASPGEELAGHMTATGRYGTVRPSDRVLFAVFRTDEEHGGSALCMYPLKAINERLVQIIGACYTNKGLIDGKNAVRSPYSTTTNFCASVQGENLVTSYKCGAEFLTSPLASTEEFALTADALYERKGKGVLTAVGVSVENEHTVAFLGTSTGEVYKVHLSSTPKVYHRRPGDGSGHGVNKNLFFDTSRTHLYIATDKRISKVPVQACHLKTDCQLCMAQEDPYCGWCVLEGRCTRKVECGRAEEVNGWLWSPKQECVKIESFEPPNLSCRKTQEVKVGVSAFPSIRESDRLQCRFGSFVCEASMDGSQITCRLADHVRIPPTPDKQDFVAVPVKILVNETVEVAAQHFKFYNCSAAMKKVENAPCLSCVTSDWGCQWNTQDHTCSDSDNSIGGAHIIKHEQGARCPRFESQDLELIPVGFKTPIRFEGVNLDVYKGREFKMGTELMKQAEEAATPEGHSRFVFHGYEFSYSKAPTVNVLFHVKDAGTDKKIDSTLNVTLYNCSVGREDCSLCKNATPQYQCVWCARTRSCVYSELCLGNDNQDCPSPKITDILPRYGPLKGGISVTIRGSNLGIKKEDIKRISVAGVPCTHQQDRYSVSTSVVCEIGPVDPLILREGEVEVEVEGGKTGRSTVLFTYRDPHPMAVEPARGLKAGGTVITITGRDLHTATKEDLNISVGTVACAVETFGDKITCKTGEYTAMKVPSDPLTVKVWYGKNAFMDVPRAFQFWENPKVESHYPKGSFICGGRNIVVTGNGFDLIQKAVMRVRVSAEDESDIPSPAPEFDQECWGKNDTVLQFLSPTINETYENQSFRTFVFLDNARSELKPFDYHPDPVFNKLTKNVITETSIISVTGRGFAKAMTAKEAQAFVGDVPCLVTTLQDDRLFLDPPYRQPTSRSRRQRRDTSSEPLDLVIQFGKGEWLVGSVRYERKYEAPLPIIIPAVIFPMLLIIAVSVYCYRRKSQQAEREYEKVKHQLENLEESVRDRCKKEFTDLMIEMEDHTSDLSEARIPFLDYKTYTDRVFFLPSKDGANDVMITGKLDIPEARRAIVTQALNQFSNLLNSKTFLINFIRTLEGRPDFNARAKVYFASLLTVALHGKLEYYTDIMRTLLLELMEQYVHSKNPKLMLRRSETVVERMLCNWMSICLYQFLKDSAGEPLYRLFKAIKHQVEKGPVDAVVKKAKYTLNDTGLLGDDVEYSVLTLQVLVLGEGPDVTPVKVLNCDTISQVKEKIIEQVYRNLSYSQRPKVDSVTLEWRPGSTGQILSDLDLTSQKEGRWKRMNTLAHYNVRDNATLVLSKVLHPQQSYDQNQDNHEERNALLEDDKVFHLVRPAEELDEIKSKRGSMKDKSMTKAITEIYLTRLLSVKGTLQQFVDNFFRSVLCSGAVVPPAVKYFFDFLDEQALKHDNVDEETIHIWKTNSLPLRFWVNILKNPHFIFDVHVTEVVDASLSVIAQTFMDACTKTEHKLSRDSPSNKLLYAKEISTYKKMVDDYYKGIRQMVSVSDQDMNTHLAEVSRSHTDKLNTQVALHQLYQYASKYYDGIITSLDEDPAAQSKQLTLRLQQIAAALENKVTDL
ncbi:plexin-B2-like isoform X1 [Anguilla anguilla]|nr:plexin-B2-like isoform X1 [Anguilla anguilla]